MLVSEYLVEFLVKKSIDHVFSYPGGMVTYLMDAFSKRSEVIHDHILYHEQACAFAACSYAQQTGKPGVCYATSGPGATNLITGIANAYFDSIPVLFITGQVNTYEGKGVLPIRQKGFQETNIVPIVSSITKYVLQFTSADSFKKELEKAYRICLEGRKGPVLLDIPMNIQCSEITAYTDRSEQIAEQLITALSSSQRPLIIAGNGIRISQTTEDFRKFVFNWQIPVLTSMIAVDLMPRADTLNMGFLGAYGHRYANFALTLSDCIIVLGSRLDIRQTGNLREKFAPQAKIYRIDVDRSELLTALPQEIVFEEKLENLLKLLAKQRPGFEIKNIPWQHWLEMCGKLKDRLSYIDDQDANRLIFQLSQLFSPCSVITTDVGQNQVWCAQSLDVKKGQRILFSGGHASMGYSLPAAIGVAYSSNEPVYCFCGDGGLQMNIQELQTVVRDRLNIKIILINNHSLGMIRHFQEMYFHSHYAHTVLGQGYSVPHFISIAKSYGLRAYSVSSLDDIQKLEALLLDDEPAFIECSLSDKTYVFPKLAMGRPMYDQEPLMERSELAELLSLCEE